MTAKKIKQVKSEENLTLENIKVGDKILDLHDENVIITEDLIEQMRRYEQESKKNAIWKGKITGMFLFFKYIEDHPEEKLKTKKKPGRKPKVKEEELEETNKLDEMEDEVIEEQVVDEENLLKDAIADYKTEYGVKTVNTKSQKFKQFYYKWKQSD